MRWRIALPYVVVVLLTLAALTAYLTRRVEQSRLGDYEGRLRAEAGLVLSLLDTGAVGPGDLQQAAGSWAAALGTRITLVDAAGVVLADSESDPATMANHADRPEVRQALGEGYGLSRRYSATVGYDMLYVAVAAPGDPAGVSVVRLAIPFQDIAESVTQLRRAMLAAAVVASAVVVATSFLLADRISRPLRLLARQVRHLASEDGGPVAPTQGYDEVQQLASAFAGMAGELNAKVSGLAEERNKIALVLAHLADGVVITDGDGRVSLANPAAVRLLGLPAQEPPVGRPLPDLADDNVSLIWRRCHESGDEHEIVIERPERGAFLRAVCTPISGARPAGEVLVLQDLSQVRRLETVRRDFISNISHELRTPLASLRALVETLQDGALEDAEAAPGFLQRMAVEVDALTQMVQELLELSRIESGQVPIRVAPTDVAAMVREPLDRLLTQAERAGLRLEADLPPEQLTVLADEERIKQVLTNIVHNAIKFTPAGGRVTVRAARAGAEVVISIADTGPGIPAKDLPRIFERFYKADRARAGGGTGLGLAIAKHIVQAHGGRIWAESRLGQGSGQRQEAGGSTFYFTLSAAS